MVSKQKEALRQYVTRWQKASPLLQDIRDADTRAADTVAMIACCNLLFRNAVNKTPPTMSSGLVQQQHWFGKLRQS